MPKGFAKPAIQRFTIEVSRRSLAPVPDGEEPPRDVDVENYTLTVNRRKGKVGWDRCVMDAVELAHLRIYELLNQWEEKHGEDPPVAFDAFLWRNRTEGQPIFQLSTSPFKGSGQLPVISDPGKSAEEIIATKEVGRVVKKY
jgi:hypothetical protein